MAEDIHGVCTYTSHGAIKKHMGLDLDRFFSLSLTRFPFLEHLQSLIAFVYVGPIILSDQRKIPASFSPMQKLVG